MGTFIGTLIGAFFGVSAPFAIARWIERRDFRRALDTFFVLSETYTQGLRARGNFIRGEPAEARAKLFVANTDPPTGLCADLASSYGKFLRSDQVYLLTQAEQNLMALYRNLTGLPTGDEKTFTVAYDSLVEHSARRSWLLYCIASGSEEQFTGERYNQLVESLNQSTERRVSTVRMLAPPNY